ncbi:MAG: glycoside hydrolase family 97 catalytic domain-containing protein [Flavisolibacter sp.]
MITKNFIVCALFFLSATVKAQVSAYSIASPDNQIVASVIADAKQINYKIDYHGKEVLKKSRLGLIREDEDFANDLHIVSVSGRETVRDQYELFTGKRKMNHYAAHRLVIHAANNHGKKLDIIFQVSNDGLGFRYYFPGQTKESKTIKEEVTSFHFDTSTRAFLQPMQVAKTGWEHSNPAYEEHYRQEIPVTDSSTFGAGWVYPALFHCEDTWILLTESSVDSNYCATRLRSKSPDGEYGVGFPDPREVFTGQGYLPVSTLPSYSPWRVIAIGTLKTIVESTLGTDLAKPSIKMNTAFVKPGKSSWSWIMSKDDSIVYSEQIRYIDFAAKMNWQYCLVDAAWDQKIGYDKIKELSRYAASKKVGLLLWYNSSGDWNTVKYTPKSKLLTHEDSLKEFGRLRDMGIKGVKIDFFGGDGQSVMKYYIDILKDAAQFQLMVNFHGATLPRGWQRTYPNLLTMEAIKGFEYITFSQHDADAEPNHAAMLPFTRNAFDPMDFTPMNLYKIETSRVTRRTSSAFELATSVMFLSGIQHFAESPGGMEHVPVYVQQFLKELPTRWDDVKFIEGYPGKYVVLARRAGNKWYLACINGENSERTVNLDLSSFSKQKGYLITDGNEQLTFTTSPVRANSLNSIKVQPNGGFVLVVE